MPSLHTGPLTAEQRGIKVLSLYNLYTYLPSVALFLDFYPWLPVCCWDVEVFVSLR